MSLGHVPIATGSQLLDRAVGTSIILNINTNQASHFIQAMLRRAYILSGASPDADNTSSVLDLHQKITVILGEVQVLQEANSPILPVLAGLILHHPTDLYLLITDVALPSLCSSLSLRACSMPTDPRSYIRTVRMSCFILQMLYSVCEVQKIYAITASSPKGRVFVEESDRFVVRYVDMCRTLPSGAVSNAAGSTWKAYLPYTEL